MFETQLIMFASLGALIFIFAFYFFIYLLERSPYIGWWALGWLFFIPVNLLSYVFEVPRYHSKDLLICDGLFFLLTSMCNFIGTLLFVNKTLPKWFFCSSLGIISILLIGRHTFNSIYPLSIITILYIGIIRVWAGIALLRVSSRGSLQYYLGWAYVLWSTNIGALSLLYLNGVFKLIVFSVFEGIPLFLALGFLMLYIRQTNESYKQDEQQIKYINVHDKLTGVYNRDYYEDVIERVGNNPKQLPLSFIFCDVNGLKLINDTLGHKQGDELLKKIATLLTTTCRKDDFIVRWGGDEFIFILPGTSNSHAYEIVTRIRDASLLYPPEPIPLSMAIGFATYTGEGESIDDVIKKAEEDMYANKLREGNNTRLAIINALGQLLFKKDYETKEHVDRLESLVREIGIHLDLPESLIKNYCLVAKLHDIGKITIPEHILKKQGSLNSVEWECMKKHAEAGYRLAHSTGEFAIIAEAILYHHEHWDGNGYPQGLSGHDIPISSRIIAIADAYDVMVHDRSYKKAMSAEEALNELIRCSGTQFDPDLVDIFIKMTSRFDEVATGIG
ncbi:MAG: bifunctional diguanylate cyclase/phosphohydrolase [Desulfitobacteriaceae bacterium]